MSFLPLWWGRHDLAMLIVGILLLDVGVQGLQVTNQSLIYRLAPDARSRINSAYMVCYFAGGALGSASAAPSTEPPLGRGVRARRRHRHRGHGRCRVRRSAPVGDVAGRGGGLSRSGAGPLTARDTAR